MTEVREPSATTSTPAASVPWWREPLLHFAVLGLGLVLAYRLLGPATKPVSDERFEIEVPQSVLEEAHEYLLRTLKREPSEQELERLVDRYIGDEILYREATALGLHRDDPILRAQLIDKMLAYSTSLMPPTEQQLRQHLEVNRSKFERPERIAFQHVFFGKQRPRAEKDARSLSLADADGDGGKAVGADSFPFGGKFIGRSRQELSSLFGEEFAKRLFALEPGTWSDPIESRHGWHRVRVENRLPAELPPLEEVRQVLLRDYEAVRRQETRQQTLARLRSKYHARLPSEGAARDPSGQSP